MKRTFLGLCCGAVLALAACGGDGGSNGGNSDAGTSTPDAGPTTITVRGTVVYSTGRPVANVPVLVLGKQTVVSDASGTFSVSGVTTPYDLAVVSADKQSAIVYKGVTRQDPSLTMPGNSSLFSAKVVGSVTGALKASATVAEPDVVFVSADSPLDRASYDASTSTYTADVSWSGPPTITGSLFAFQGERTSGSSGYTKFTGFGRRDNVSLSHGAMVSNQSIALSSVANSTLAGTVTVPKDFGLFLQTVDLEFGPAAQVPLFSDISPTASFSYAVPVVAQSTLRFTSGAITADAKTSILGIKTGVAAGTRNVSLALKAPSSLLLPLDGATQVTRSTEFSWSELAGGVHLVSFTKTSSGTPYSLTLVTNASRTTIPDVSALGMGLPANASLRWQLTDLSPIASVDGMLVENDASGLPTGLNEFYLASAAERTLTVSSAP